MPTDVRASRYDECTLRRCTTSTTHYTCTHQVRTYSRLARTPPPPGITKGRLYLVLPPLKMECGSCRAAISKLWRGCRRRCHLGSSLFPFFLFFWFCCRDLRRKTTFLSFCSRFRRCGAPPLSGQAPLRVVRPRLCGGASNMGLI